jgi:shikimate kinase
MSPAGEPAEPNTTSVVLIGFMGAGKSTAGRALAARLGIPFVDCDEVIEREHGPISAIFAAEGERAFRDLEQLVVARVLDEARASPRVVALGGGSVTSEAVRRSLTGFADVVWLQAPLDDLWCRAGAGESASRPLARDKEAFARLLEQREALYAEVARIRVACHASRDIDAVVHEIVRRTGAGRQAVGR